MVPAGTWVAVEQTLLRPGERAAGIPPETAEVPLTARVKGFLVEEARIGGEARVRTMAGREVAGTLVEANPAYTHGFGEIVPEILTAGEEARERLRSSGSTGRDAARERTTVTR